MADKANSPTRRALLGALGVSPVIGLLAATPYVAAAQAPDTAEWDTAMALYLAAKAEEEAFDRDFFEPAQAEHLRRCGPRPDLSFVITARNGESARYVLSPPDFETVPFPQFQREATRIRSEWERWARLDQQWTSRLNLAALEERSDELYDRAYDLKWQLLKMPAPTREALRWKLEHLFTPDNVTWNDEVIADLHADARRLLGGEA